MKNLALSSLLCVTSASLHAGEHTVTESNFETKLSLDVTLIPTKATIVHIEPEEWSDFVVQEVVEHGSTVKAGDVLVKCDREDYDKKLADANKAVRSRKLTLGKAQRELTDLELTTPRSLEGERLAFVTAKETLDYFTTTGRDLEERGAKERLDSAKMSLEYVQEELKQLLMMYEEDGVTEDTEEIILKRQRIALKRAKFGLERAELGHKWTMEKTIPRKAVDLQRKYDSALLKYETAQLSLPRALELNQIAVEKAIKDDQKADEKLAKMKAATEFFTVKAPSDGMVYFGEIKEHSWSASGAEKFLKEDGKLPTDTPLLSIIAADSTYNLHSTVGQAERLKLAQGNTASVTFEGLDGEELGAKLTKLALVPNAAGKYPVSFSITLPADSPLVTGMSGKADVVTYQNAKALTVPSSVLSKKNGKSMVMVKLADGKSESREVKVGKSSDGNTEILSGLEIDQVVITPDAKK
ncbi:hypothetical protein N9224_00395 [Akkermansiaceae bacterium]|nr:hypothetical protein [Akkermansiaceae bacterium]